MNGIFFVGLIKSLLKFYSSLYFLVLPILYSEGVIDSVELGYIGTLLILGTMVVGGILSYIPNKFTRRAYLGMTLLTLGLSLIMLTFYQQKVFIILAYILFGTSLGTGFITLDEIAAQLSEKGKRYKSFANIAMLTDIARIICPALAGFMYLYFKFPGLIVLAFGMFVITIALVYLFSRRYSLEKRVEVDVVEGGSPIKLLKENKPFTFSLFLEFLDSFASSQLFVFLPTLLIFKNFEVEYAVGLQSIVFLGYFSGRAIISIVASKFSGPQALSFAETGMVITILLLLILPPSFLLYVLCFLLGVFARGTSPVIKAMVFDELNEKQLRQGTALYMLIGDGGSSTGQLLFGILMGVLGVHAPFIVAAIAAGIVAIACLRSGK